MDARQELVKTIQDYYNVQEWQAEKLVYIMDQVVEGIIEGKEET